MKWLTNLLHGTTPPVAEDDVRQVESARQERIHAQAALREAQRLATQMRGVVIVAKQVRSENQFSTRLSEAFGSRPHNG